MIRSFRHKGIEAYFRTGSTSGIQTKHAKRLRLQLARLEAASVPNDMGVPAGSCIRSRVSSPSIGRYGWTVIGG